MTKPKAFGAPAQHVKDKLAVLLARQDAYRLEVQRAQSSEALIRSRLGLALAQILAERARADYRYMEAAWAHYLEVLKGRSRPDRRNRIRRHAEKALIGLGELGGKLVVQWSGIKAGAAQDAVFDASWYSTNNPDASNMNVDPLAHYLALGGQEGRSPHRLFDVNHYRTVALDLDATGLTPLAHYVRLGFARGLSPHPLFDVKYYLSQAPDLVETGEYPLQHYLRIGAARDLSPHRLFQPHFYKSQTSEPEAQANPFLHYLDVGFRSGLKPNPLFDTAWFKAAYPDVGDQEPIGYYVRYGAERLLNPGPWFDTEHYLAHRGETWIKDLDPLSEYLAGGAWTILPNRQEGAASAFAASFPDAAETGQTPLEFWAGVSPDGVSTISGLRPSSPKTPPS